MKLLMKSIKQLFCIHWFDEQPVRDYNYSVGLIICGEQKTCTVTVQPRICSKCGLKEERRIGEPIYNGWT